MRAFARGVEKLHEPDKFPTESVLKRIWLGISPKERSEGLMFETTRPLVQEKNLEVQYKKSA